MKSICAMCLFVICNITHAEIYKYVDPVTGAVEYTNQPKGGAVRLSTGETIRDLNGRAKSPQQANPNTQRGSPLSDSGPPYVEITERAGATYSVNTRAFSGYGPALGVWIMANWATTQFLPKPPPPNQTNRLFGLQEGDAALRAFNAYAKGAPAYLSTLTLYTFDCGRRTADTQDVIWYAEKFAEGEEVSRTRGLKGIENVVPGTLLETLMDKSCGLARQRGIAIF